MSLLSVRNLSIRFNNQPVLSNVSFEVAKGDFLAIMGPNGAGKTALFRAILGLNAYEGEVQWPKNVKIGYVPQRLFIERDLPLTVLEFLKLKNAHEGEVYEALEAVGFLKGHEAHHLEHHLLEAKLGQLSGGELQRVLIAYALINHPDILLFDEPTAGVDIGGEETIYSLLEKLHAEHKLTIIIITHDLSVISKYAEKVLCLNKEEICFGTPKEVLTPKVLEELYGTNIGFYPHEHRT